MTQIAKLPLETAAPSVQLSPPSQDSAPAHGQSDSVNFLEQFSAWLSAQLATQSNETGESLDLESVRIEMPLSDIETTALTKHQAFLEHLLASDAMLQQPITETDVEILAMFMAGNSLPETPEMQSDSKIFLPNEQPAEQSVDPIEAIPEIFGAAMMMPTNPQSQSPLIDSLPSESSLDKPAQHVSQVQLEQIRKLMLQGNAQQVVGELPVKWELAEDNSYRDIQHLPAAMLGKTAAISADKVHATGFNPLSLAMQQMGLVTNPQVQQISENLGKKQDHSILSELGMMVDDHSGAAKASGQEPGVQQLQSLFQSTPSNLNTKLNAASIEAPMQLSARGNEAGEVLAERVNMMMSKNLKHVDIRLDPPELGRMQIKLALNQDQATVQITVANQSAREIVEQSMPRLREMMQQQGLQLAQSSVDQQDSGQRQSLAQQNGQEQSNQKQSSAHELGVHEFDSGGSSDAPGFSQTLNIKPQQLGRVDYYA